MVRLDDAEPVAVDACLAAGGYLRRAYHDGSSEVEHSAVDAKSSADVEAETRMLDVLEEAFPDHTVDAEESGRHPGDDRYRWIVDPLDGTNNFEAGLPSFATAVTLVVDGDPALAAAHVPLSDDLYVCRRDRGLRYGSTPVDGDETPAPSPEAATVMSVVGHDVKRDADASAVSAAIDRGIEAVCKRRLESWSPTVHWGLLARGRLDGAVCYRPDAEEQRLGELFVDAVDHETARGDDGSWFVAARTPRLQGELRAVVEDAIGTTSSSRR
jgi:myo-inositol-1(or 4)-monophosphatase